MANLRTHFTIYFAIIAAIIAAVVTKSASAEPVPAVLPSTRPATKPASALFARSNLVAWCIVPYDGKQRTPAQRAEMLDRIGLHKFAYDWRAKHLPGFVGKKI